MKSSLGEASGGLAQQLDFCFQLNGASMEKARTAVNLPEGLSAKEGQMPHRNNSFNESATFAALALCGSILLSACSNLPTPSQPVRHVVLMWLRHPERVADRAQLFRAARSLQMMPGVLRVEIGRALPPPPPGIDRSFDLGVVITFRDRTALARYEQDPRRQGMLRRYLRPLVRRYEVYDPSTR